MDLFFPVSRLPLLRDFPFKRENNVKSQILVQRRNQEVDFTLIVTDTYSFVCRGLEETAKMIQFTRNLT